jgi:hypothetical protein
MNSWTALLFTAFVKGTAFGRGYSLASSLDTAQFITRKFSQSE